MTFPPLTNDRLLRAARFEPVDRVPVWMMRQAGRYLPEFQAVRAEHPFFEVCRTPELACEVTLQPLRRFDLDASIIFSDILVVPQAMGMEVQMIKGRGPVLPDPLRAPADLRRLRPGEPDAAELRATYDALALTRREIGGRVPLIGFSGAPWTLMAYMVEGGGSKTWATAKRWLYAEPDASRDLLDRLATSVAGYLIAQADAGAQALQVFDSHAGELAPSVFRQLVLPGLRDIAARVKDAHPNVPLIGFARGAHHALRDLADAGYDIVGVDERVELATARAAVDGRAAVQGNLSPSALFAPPERLRQLVGEMLDSAATPEHGLRGVIANLGHGMLPTHTPEMAGAFAEAVHDLSAPRLAS